MFGILNVKCSPVKSYFVCLDVSVLILICFGGAKKAYRDHKHTLPLPDEIKLILAGKSLF